MEAPDTGEDRVRVLAAAALFMVLVQLLVSNTLQQEHNNNNNTLPNITRHYMIIYHLIRQEYNWQQQFQKQEVKELGPEDRQELQQQQQQHSR